MSWNDDRVEKWVGLMLRTGVLLAAAVVLIGGALYMAQNRGPRPDYSKFQGEPAAFATLRGAATGVATLEPRSIIMFGLLLLIATPVARVAMCVAGFAFERDRLYVAVSTLVLLILLYSVFFHH
jgi:uncharacterized membrane protein